MSGRGGKRKGKYNKAQYYKQSAKKPRTDGSEPVNLTENLQGFLISCNSNEYQTLRESYNVLNEAADRLYGEYNSSESTENPESDDIAASIAAEIATLKSSAERRFIQAKTKCNNVLFIRTNDPKVDPNGLVREILDEVRRIRKANCRYIQRFIPVVGTFKANELEKVEESFRVIFDKFATKSVRSFSVIAKVRNNSGFKSETALKETVIRLIRDVRPNWLLNHSEANTMVMINITQRAGCVSILDDFYQYSKYNLVEFGKKCSDDKGASDKKVEDSEAVTAADSEPTDGKAKDSVDADQKLDDSKEVLKDDASSESTKVKSEDSSAESAKNENLDAPEVKQEEASQDQDKDEGIEVSSPQE